MRPAATLAMGMAAICSPALAEDIVDGMLQLHFSGPNGEAKTIEFVTGFSAADIGTDHCGDSLGGVLEYFERDARKQLTDVNMTLDSITCEALGDEWVKVTTSVPTVDPTDTRTAGIAMYYAGADGTVKPVLVTPTIYDGAKLSIAVCESLLAPLTQSYLSDERMTGFGQFVKSECVDVDTFPLKAN